MALLPDISSAIAGRLRSVARAGGARSKRRRGELQHEDACHEDVWKLCQISQAIIVSESPEALLSSIAARVREAFGIEYCAVFRPTPGDELQLLSESFAFESGDGQIAGIAPTLPTVTQVFRTGVARRQQGQGISLLPLKAGERTVGVIALSPPTLKWETVEAVAGLVAMAFERARFLGELDRTELLKQSDELKSLLLASVSHDLRTPLTSIRAAVESLLDQELCLSPAELREFHLIISEEAQRLTRLVEGLLRMGRIEAGQLRPDCRWESVGELCDNVLERCAAELQHHRVRVECDGALPVVKFDARLVAEALAHLIENAAKYSPTGSQIVVRLRVTAGELVVSVADEGPGVAPDEVEHIFAQFYRGQNRGHHSPHEPPSGTGLGLAIARGIVEACGGRIWVESLPGRGATFTFALPVETHERARAFIHTR
jgi:K+-sensing histidine kinase KdpD